MRAREFVINIPLTIRINGADSSDLDMQATEAKDPSELDPNPTMVPPLQQAIELKKANAGKESPVIAELIRDEEPEDDSEF
jgi:hypothetical protein